VAAASKPIGFPLIQSPFFILSKKQKAKAKQKKQQPD